MFYKIIFVNETFLLKQLKTNLPTDQQHYCLIKQNVKFLAYILSANALKRKFKWSLNFTGTLNLFAIMHDCSIKHHTKGFIQNIL